MLLVFYYYSLSTTISATYENKTKYPKVLILIQKIHKTRSCRGISFKTQALYLGVFATRYVDLLTGPYYSLYNTIMKLIFLASSAWIVYLMRGKYRWAIMSLFAARHIYTAGNRVLSM